MASPLELHLTLSSAKDLKNVNWRHGILTPYAVVWIDPETRSKCSTKADQDNDTSPRWNENLVLPFTCPVQDSTLSIDIVHSYPEEDTKPLIGSARIPIQDVIDDVGFGEWTHRSLKLKRPSGRPQGKMEIEVMVRRPQPQPYYAPPPQPYYAPAAYPYGTAPAGGYPPYAQPGYGAPGYSTRAPEGEYSPYAQPGYGAPGYSGAPEVKSGGSKFGVGTGLAVGAVAGVLGGLALAEGIDAVEDNIADDVEDTVADDFYEDGDGF